MSHFNLERKMPFGWSYRTEVGGSSLTNNFTHTLSIVLSVVGGKLLSIISKVRDDLGKASVIDGIHYFTKRRYFILRDVTDPSLLWGTSNVERSYTTPAYVGK